LIPLVKYLSLGITFSFFNFNAFGQQGKIDSLLSILKASFEDSIKVNTLNELSREFKQNGNNDTALIVAENAKNLADKIKYKKGLANAFGSIGSIYKSQGSYDKALTNYFASLKIKEQVGDKKGIANTHGNIGTVYNKQGNYSEALKSNLICLKIKKEIGDKKGVGDTYNNIGNIYYGLGDYHEALTNFFACLAILNEIAEKKNIGAAYGNIGRVYRRQGNYPEALKNYFTSLKFEEKAGNKIGIGNAYNNIANVYENQGDYTQALKNHFISLKIREKSVDKHGIGDSYNNIGNVYFRQGNYAHALKNNFAALKIREEMGDKRGIGDSYLNIGDIYFDEGNLASVTGNVSLAMTDKYPLAMKNYVAALAVKEKIGDQQGVANALINIGRIFTHQKKYKEAREYETKGLLIYKKIGEKDGIRDSYNALEKNDSAQGNFKGAYENHKLAVLYRDSLLNEKNTKKTVQIQMQYSFDKKESLAKAEQDKKDALAAEEKQRQKLITYSISTGLFLVLLLALFIYRGYRQKQKTNLIITQKKSEVEKQKHIIEEKHKEITDSINYAERIQRSFLASTQLLDENLKDHFVFFQPKDVVSGDFYWATKLKNNNFILVTADSTGHGVPGAIMSILNISCLEKSVEEEKLVEPAEILNHTRSKIIERLKKDGSISGGKDGMDCSLISFDFQNNKFTYACANNPVWAVREKQILEFTPDKMPVGKHDKDMLTFNQHTVDLQKGDVVYAFTDGLPDQFGGPRGKKFMYKQLKELLIGIAHLPMPEQKETLKQSLDKWKGNLEQVDDICLIGIRI